MVRKFGIAILTCFTLLLIGIYLLAGSLLVCAYVATTTILILAILVSGFLLANRWFRNTNRYKNQFIGTDKFINSIKYRTNHIRNFDIANIGSSSGVFAFDYNDTGLKGCNWAMAPESLTCNFRVLKNYFSFLKDGGTILFTITPFGFCLKDYTDDRINTKYYLYLSPKLIPGFSPWKRLFRIKYPLLSSPVQALKSVIRDTPVDNRLSLKINLMSPEELEADAAKWVENWKRQFNILDMEASVAKHNVHLINYNTILLDKMITFCLERNLKPAIVLPPTTSAMSSLFSDHFCESYIYSIIRNANQGRVPFLDYLHDERFAIDEYFFNSFFLNSKGRRVFTQAVLNDLKLIEDRKTLLPHQHLENTVTKDKEDVTP